jgi:hypothetical protein
MKYARIIDNVVQEVVDFDPAERFHPDVAALFELVPDDVGQNDTRDADGAFTAYVPPVVEQPTAVEPPKPVLSPVQFKMCFTAPERIGLKALRASDPLIDDWMTLLDDPRLNEVDLNLASTQTAIGYLVGKLTGFTEERAAQVKAGEIL